MSRNSSRAGSRQTSPTRPLEGTNSLGLPIVPFSHQHSEVSRVNQCSRCGALTMLVRCPRCDGPTVSPGLPAGGPPQHQPGQSVGLGPRGGGIPSPAPAVVRTMAPPAPTHQSERSRSGPSVPVSPARLVPVAATPYQPESPAASLRSDVDHLQSELRMRTQELSSIKADASSTAHTKHEVEELWRTIRKQNEDLERSALLEAELRSMQQRYEALAQERDRWMKDCLVRQEQANDTVSRAADEVDSMREELRRLSAKLHESEIACGAAKRQASDAESALETQKSKVQRTTQEVKDLQQAIQTSRNDDRQAVAEAQLQVQTVHSELRQLEIRYRTLEAQNENCVRREAHDAERIRMLEDQLQLTEAESRATQEEVSNLRQRLTTFSQQATRAQSEQQQSEAKQNRELQRDVVGLRDTIDKLEERHRLLTLELAEAHGKLESERLTLRHQTDRDSRASEEVDLWKRRAEEAESMKDRLARQVDELRLEVIQLNNEAESAASLLHLKSNDSTSRTATLEARCQELTATIRQLRDELSARGEELHQSKQALTASQIEMSREHAERANIRREQEDAALAREQFLRKAHEEQMDTLRRQCDEQHIKLSRLESLVESKELQHSQDKGAMRAELVAMQSKCESMRFECERLQSNSPRRVARQIEQEQLKTRSEQQQREAAERRIEEHKVLLENIRAELGVARQETAEGRETIARLQRQMATLKDLLGTATVEDLLPAVNRLLQEKEQFSTTLRRQDTDTERRVLELRQELTHLEEARDRFKNDAETNYTSWKQTSQKLEKMQAALEKQRDDMVAEVTRERDWIQAELESTRIKHQRQLDDTGRELGHTKARLEECDANMRRMATERDAMQRQNTDTLKEHEQIRRAHADLQSRFGQSQSDVAGQNAVILELESKVKELTRLLQRTEQDKDRITSDAASVKAAAESETAEVRQRLEDLRSKHQKELESIRATLRLERDKVLTEVENTHTAELRISELELSLDSLRAERERMNKELELARRAQSNKADSYHQLVEEASKERESLRRELEELRHKHSNLLKEHDGAVRDKRRLEEEADQHIRQRDMALRQLDSAKLERDVAMKSALDVRNNINTGGTVSRSASGGGLVGRSASGGGGGQQGPPSPIHHRRISPSRAQRGPGVVSHQDPSPSTPLGYPDPGRRISPSRVPGPMYPVHPAASSPPPPLMEPRLIGTPPPNMSSSAYLPAGQGQGQGFVGGAGGGNNSSSYFMAPRTQQQQQPSAYSSQSSQPQPSSSYRSASAKDRNDALFAHFREQQHSAQSNSATNAATPVPPPTLSTPGREDSLPLGAYRR